MDSQAIAPAQSSQSLTPQRSAKAGLLALVALLYLVVSGGAYGIEDAVRVAGPRLTLLLCLIIPVTLSLPTALMAAELTALMPVEGGFYFWVKAGLGSFAGFAEAWLTMLFTIADTAIYPVLFGAYLSYLFPIGGADRILLALALIWGAGLLNLSGIRAVGRSSIAMTAALLAPFGLLVLVGSHRLLHWQMPAPAGGSFLVALGGGLTVVMWNFGGWENLSTVSGELETPGRNYLRGVLLALPIVVLGYLLPLAVALSGAKSTGDWQTGTFAGVGAHLGGAWLGALLALGGSISAFAMFNAALLWISRLLFVLAREGYLPRELGGRAAAEAGPRRAVVACCILFSLLAPLGFLTLVIFDVFFYMLALALEMAALIRLRTLQPERAGKFMIGGGRGGLYLVAAAPLLTWLATFGFALAQGVRRDLLMAMLLAATTAPAYLILRRAYDGPESTAQRGAGGAGDCTDEKRRKPRLPTHD